MSGRFAFACGPQRATSWAQIAQISEILSARDFPDRPGLVLADKKGTPRAMLATTNRGPVLRLYDGKGTPRAGLSATKNGSALALSDKDGKEIWRAP